MPIAKKDCHDPDVWQKASGGKKGVCIQFNKNASKQVEPKNPARQKLKLLKGQCVGSQYEWVVGQGCYSVGQPLAVSEKPLLAPPVQPPREAVVPPIKAAPPVAMQPPREAVVPPIKVAPPFQPPRDEPVPVIQVPQPKIPDSVKVAKSTPHITIGGHDITSFSGSVGVTILEPTQAFKDQQKSYGLNAPVSLLFSDIHGTKDNLCEACTCTSGGCCVNASEDYWFHLLDKMSSKKSPVYVMIENAVNLGTDKSAVQDREKQDTKRFEIIQRVAETAKNCFTQSDRRLCSFKNIFFNMIDPRTVWNYLTAPWGRITEQQKKADNTLILEDYSEAWKPYIPRYFAEATLDTLTTGESNNDLYPFLTSCFISEEVMTNARVTIKWLLQWLDKPSFEGYLRFWLTAKQGIVHKEITKCRGALQDPEWWIKLAMRSETHQAWRKRVESTVKATSSQYKARVSGILEILEKATDIVNAWSRVKNLPLTDKGSGYVNLNGIILDMYMLARSFKSVEGGTNPSLTVSYVGDFHAENQKAMLIGSGMYVESYEQVSFDRSELLPPFDKISLCQKITETLDIDAMLRDDYKAPSAPLKKPTRTAKVQKEYERIKRLDIGTLGELWLVKDSDGQEYAAKFYDDKRLPDYGEINMLFTLDHPTLLQGVDLWIDTTKFSSNKLAVILPLADGTLESMWRPTNVDDTVMAMFALLSGLAFLHKYGNFHCNINPSSILMIQDTPVIADFGMSFPTIANPLNTCKNPGYMSPQTSQSLREYVESEKNKAFYADGLIKTGDLLEKPDFVQGDIYSMGLVFLWMITGRNNLVKFEDDPEKQMSEIEGILTDIKYSVGTDKRKEYVPLLKEMLQPQQLKRAKTADDLLALPIFTSRGLTPPLQGRLKLGPIGDATPDKQAMRECKKLAEENNLSSVVLANAVSLVMRSWYLDIVKSGGDLAILAIEMTQAVLGQISWSRNRKSLEQLALKLDGILLTPTIVTKGASDEEVTWWVNSLIAGKYNLTPESLEQAHNDWLKK